MKNLQDRIEQLEDAKEMLTEAHELIQTAIRGTRAERYTRAYLLDHLRIMISDDHSFLSNDLNLDKVMENLNEENEEDEFEENEE
jgi:hypothetical protein